MLFHTHTHTLSSPSLSIYLSHTRSQHIQHIALNKQQPIRCKIRTFFSIERCENFQDNSCLTFSLSAILYLYLYSFQSLCNFLGVLVFHSFLSFFNLNLSSLSVYVFKLMPAKIKLPLFLMK